MELQIMECLERQSLAGTELLRSFDMWLDTAIELWIEMHA